MSTHTHTHTDNKKKFEFNRKTFVTMMVVFAVLYLVGIGLWGLFMNPDSYGVNYDAKFISPSLSHPFGTDFMGRDMFSRCIKALSNSLIIGVLASIFSSFIALVMGVSSAVFGGKVDKFVNWCVDLCQGLPHLVLLILISFMLGKGVKGVTLSVIFTHWPSLTRIVRAEVLQVRSSQFVQAAYKMGKTKWQVAKDHILPHVIPSYIVGLILLFPHAIMHEASVTFLGFGLPKEMPAIGVILAESMDYLATGKWWLAVFPGLMLLIAVVLFDVIGDNLKKLWNPQSGNE